MRWSWIKRKKLVPNQNLTSEKAKTDRKYKKMTYPSVMLRHIKVDVACALNLCHWELIWLGKMVNRKARLAERAVWVMIKRLFTTLINYDTSIIVRACVKLDSLQSETLICLEKKKYGKKKFYDEINFLL